MIVGLRLRPWLDDERRRNPTGIAEFLTDCDKCMERFSDDQRQLMGCGYLPADPSPIVRASVWRPPERRALPDEVDDDGLLLHPVCAGYASTLPEVIEATQAHAFFKSGGLLQFTDGPPTPMLRDAVLTIESEHCRVIDVASKRKGGQ